MTWLIVALGAAGALIAMLAGKSVVRLRAGHRYRFSWRLVPGMAGPELTAMVASLSSAGSTENFVSGGLRENTGSYVMVAAIDKDITIGEPSVIILGHELTFTNVEELPA